MTTEIRMVQFFDLTDAKGNIHQFQNYFVGDTKSNVPSITGVYKFAPFQVEGTTSSLNGDNEQIQVLFPATVYAIRLVEAGEGNRKSRLILSTRFVNANGDISKDGPRGVFVGLGASFSAQTVELRFNSALDAAASKFPATTLTSKNVGVLPLESQLQLR
tara:strand:- start:126 stop:605 length:480 start_codon:yes stop_codon:yes gene_type:complete